MSKIADLPLKTHQTAKTHYENARVNGSLNIIRCHRAILFSLGGIFKRLFVDDTDVDVDVVICDATLQNVEKMIDLVSML